MAFFGLCPKRDCEELRAGICFVLQALLVFLGQLKSRNNILSVSRQYRSQQVCLVKGYTIFEQGSLIINSVKCDTKSEACRIASWKWMQFSLWGYNPYQIKGCWRKLCHISFHSSSYQNGCSVNVIMFFVCSQICVWMRQVLWRCCRENRTTYFWVRLLNVDKKKKKRLQHYNFQAV